MKGFLAVNHFLRGEKFDTLHRHLCAAAERCDIQLTVKTNLEMIFETERPDFVLFWDKDITLAKQLEKKGVPLFNSAASIEACDSKALTYIALEGIVSQPETIFSPMTFFPGDFSRFVSKAVQRLGLPLVFKECFGSFGSQVFLCRSEQEILSHVTEKPFILQKFVADSAGEDKRLEIVDGECVAAVRRYNRSDFRANVTNGGRMEPCTSSREEIKTAVAACSALGLTFGGVDILNGNILCEVNSNAHIINIMNCTGTDVAPLIFETIKRKLV